MFLVFLILSAIVLVACACLFAMLARARLSAWRSLEASYVCAVQGLGQLLSDPSVSESIKDRAITALVLMREEGLRTAVLSEWRQRSTGLLPEHMEWDARLDAARRVLASYLTLMQASVALRRWILSGMLDALIKFQASLRKVAKAEECREGSAILSRDEQLGSFVAARLR